MEEVVRQAIRKSVFKSGQPENLGNKLINYLEASSEINKEEKLKRIELILDSMQESKTETSE